MSERESQGLATRAPQTMQRGFSLLPNTLGEAMELAKIIATSGLAPKDYNGKPEAVLVAIQMGADLGLKPMQSLQSIAVINGRPSIWGDAAPALVMREMERFHEAFEGTFPEDNFKAICTLKRKGFPDETVREFSIADAKAAKLWMKKGHQGGDTPWVTYPKRMLQMRARGFALRDAAPDLLLGLILAEEAQDIPIEGTVVSSEIVGDVVPPAVGIFNGLPEAVRDNIEKAFETLAFAPGTRLAKINEYFGGEGIVAEDQATLLLDWLRDEWSKRKSGAPRVKKGNTNEKKQQPEPAAASQPATPAPAESEPVASQTAAPTPTPTPPAVNSDLF